MSDMNTLARREKKTKITTTKYNVKWLIVVAVVVLSKITKNVSLPIWHNSFNQYHFSFCMQFRFRVPNVQFSFLYNTKKITDQIKGEPHLEHWINYDLCCVPRLPTACDCFATSYLL